jgi:hypothetical protein
MLRFCSGSAPVAQVKAAVAHVRTLNRNQRKGINPESRGIGARNDFEEILQAAQLLLTEINIEQAANLQMSEFCAVLKCGEIEKGGHGLGYVIQRAT